MTDLAGIVIAGLGLAVGILGVALFLTSRRRWESERAALTRAAVDFALSSIPTSDEGPQASKTDLAASVRSVFSIDPGQSSSLLAGVPVPPGEIALDEVTIRNFRNVEELRLAVGAKSELGGNWTCIAGLNGAGKSTVLQAISLLLLGERLIAELGRERLRRLWRRTAEGDRPPELMARCRIGDTFHELYLPFSEDGIDRAALASRGPEAYIVMETIWRRLQQQVVASYGATRNLSDYPDRRYASLSRQVQRQMTLFDPLTQIANVDVLLQGGKEMAPALETLVAVLQQVLDEADLGHMRIDAQARLGFQRNGAALEALDLPDGFRSTVAWLADLCVAWHQTVPDASTDPAGMRGIVMVDEIDLHLHASLQRTLIPSLRKALPHVQFIVTTHSPLILSCFDRRELVVFDRGSDTGVMHLDRQVFGMSMDEIYQWLMGTTPESPVIEEMLQRADPNAALMLAQSPSTNEKQAEDKVARRRAFLKRMQAGLPPSAS